MFIIVNMKLQSELYKIMQQENLTNAKLAAKLGISPSMLCLVLTGTKKPGRRFLQGLATQYPDICLKYLQEQMVARAQGG
jgi:transcriptional regulator with XRE-family HTH domain